jgi:hypothetical protein
VSDGPSEYPAKGAKPRASQPNGQPQVGRKAAEKYMAPRETQVAGETAARHAAGTSGDHYLAIHVGFFLSDIAYKWGAPEKQENVGKWNFGLTYRVGEWVNSMDLAVRFDLLSYGLDEGRANKMSFMPVVTFPDANSKFPLYFGAGAGLGVFLNQVPSEGSLSLDYQLFGGLRFFEVIENTGFFVEGGIKNHLHLLSDGQHNGTFAAVGTVFTF